MANVMKEDDERNDEEIVIVEEESKLQTSAEENNEDHDDRDEDEESSKSDQDDVKSAKADDEDDEDDREAIRERRRKEKQERKERREKAISRDKLELDFLRKRNDDLERRLSAQEQRAHQFDLNSFDTQIQQAQKEAEMADRVIAKAIEAGNGADAAQALKYRDEAIAKIHQLNAAKQSAQNRPAQPAQQMDDLTMHYAQQFINRNKWYDPTGSDEDSAIVLAIDRTLVNEGYDPRTEDYWDELETRAARRIPDRFNTTRRARTEPKEERTPRGGPAVGSGKEHAPNSTRKEIYISPERKQALIDAGVWDDPELRMKYVKRYAEYDRMKRG